ncbi:membrane protein [Paenibacillus sp. J31TS4]|uniref:TerC family protein n=1 Tax=Paenibacillus sp. J31TS4 TaxID=2807195 RepID=UPI001B13DEA0|nr:TerC family protein [Paenibacillus sp. J31TS4]GIP38035.1 membrane protein [Paenibacillus sp. J31TS4]
MDVLSTEFLLALVNIIIIDLVLAGDNAIVIGLAARNVPKHQQKMVILWGTFGAVVLRVLLTLGVAWLLNIPGLLLLGGLLLIWIAFKLLVDKKDHELDAKPSMMGAIRTILIADVVMGLDNVLAVAGAAHGSFLLVVTGLVISVPIVVWGSTLFLKLMEKFPWILYIGAGVLAMTAAKMIAEEKFMVDYLAFHPLVKWGFVAVVVTAVLTAGLGKNKRDEKKVKSAA